MTLEDIPELFKALRSGSIDFLGELIERFSKFILTYLWFSTFFSRQLASSYNFLKFEISESFSFIMSLRVLEISFVLVDLTGDNSGVRESGGIWNL